MTSEANGTTNRGLSLFIVPGAARTRMEPVGGKPKCSDCGYKVRGSEHKEGRQHQRIPVPRRRRKGGLSGR